MAIFRFFAVVVLLVAVGVFGFKACRGSSGTAGPPLSRWKRVFFFLGEKPREIQVEEMNTWKFVDMIWYNIWYNIWYMMFFPHHETKRSLGLEKEASVEFTDRTNACLWIYGARSSEDLRGPLRRFMAIEWGQWWTNRWNVMECFCSPSFSDNHDLHDLHGGMMECFFPLACFYSQTSRSSWALVTHQPRWSLV